MRIISKRCKNVSNSHNHNCYIHTFYFSSVWGQRFKNVKNGVQNTNETVKFEAFFNLFDYLASY